MAPDEIKDFIEKNYESKVHVRPVRGGYAFFFYGHPIAGAKSNRILRIKRESPTASLRMKLAATSRRGDEMEFAFSGNEAELKAIVDQEILVYLRHDAVA